MRPDPELDDGILAYHAKSTKICVNAHRVNWVCVTDALEMKAWMARIFSPDEVGAARTFANIGRQILVQAAKLTVNL